MCGGLLGDYGEIAINSNTWLYRATSGWNANLFSIAFIVLFFRIPASSKTCGFMTDFFSDEQAVRVSNDNIKATV